MYYDDSEDASKHFGQALHDFSMLVCGCTLLLMWLLCLLEFSNVLKVLGIRNTWMYGGKLDGVYGQSIDRFWNWLFILVGQYVNVISYCLKREKVKTKEGKLKFWFCYRHCIEARARWKNFVNKKLLVTYEHANWRRVLVFLLLDDVPLLDIVCKSTHSLKRYWRQLNSEKWTWTR